MRAKSGDEVTVVIAIDDDGQRTQVFSNVDTAQKWMDALPDETTCVCVDTMIVDVPEYGNEAQGRADG